MKHILTIFIFIIPFCLFADYKTDSLINIVHEYEKKAHFESDTNYIKTLIAAAETFGRANLDSSLLFGNKAYELSTQYGYSKWILASAFAIVPVYSRQQDAKNLLKIGNEILPVAEKTDRKSLSRVYNIIGTAYFNESFSDRTYLYQASEMFQKSLNISEEYNDTTSMIRTLTNLSATYTNMIDYSSAIEYLYRAINLAEKFETATSLSSMFFNLASFYQHQEKHEQALIEIQKGLEHAEKDNDISYIGMFQYLLSRVYLNQNKLDEAFESINKSIEILQRLNLTEQLSDAKQVLSLIYLQKGLYREALDIAYEVMEIWEEIGRDEKIFDIKIAIAGIYFEQKQYRSGLKICNEILEKGTNNILNLCNVHAAMSQMYEALNNGAKALEHFKQYKIYSDSLFHNNLNEKLINLEAENKYEKKEMELKAEQALKDAGHIKDKARLQLVIVFVLILFISVSVFLIFISQSKRKLKIAYSKLEDANNEIKFQKEEILMQSEELRTINEHLVKLIKFKQDISGMIVHDLKNPLSIMLGLTTSVPDEHSLAMLHDSAQRMLNLVLNILDINKYEDSKLELKYSRTDINDLIKSVTKDIDTSLNFRQLKINLNLQDGLEFLFDKDIIRRVLDNILNNAIKYSPENEIIHISTERNNNQVRITIRNMGEPIPAKMQEAIFEPYGRVDRKENESSVKSTGLGLAFCKMAVTAHNGIIGVESSHDNPTDFWFEIPYMKS